MSIDTSVMPQASNDDLLQIDEATANLLFRTARTVNAFSDEPVSDQQIETAYDLVRWGPTAMNSQPLRLMLVRSAQARERLVRHMGDGNKAKTLAAPLTLIVAADAQFHENLSVLAPHMQGAKERFDAIGTQARTDMARTSTLIQFGYLVVGLRSVGLSVGPMTGFDAAGVDSEFFADSSWRALVVLNVGKPANEAASHPRQARLAFGDVSITV